MALTQIPNLDYEVDGDLIHLEQNDGSGNIDRITLHRLHLRHLAGNAACWHLRPFLPCPLTLPANRTTRAASKRCGTKTARPTARNSWSLPHEAGQTDPSPNISRK